MNSTSVLPSSLLVLQWAVQGAGITTTTTTTKLAEILLAITHPTTALLLLASFLFLAHTYFSSNAKPRTKDGKPLPPLPPCVGASLPLVGNLPDLFLRKPVYKWILSLMKEMGTDIACVKFGGVHVIPVTCPEIAREFLKKHDANFASRPLTMGTEYSSRRYLSIAVAPWGDQWKKMRRAVASEVINPARLRWLLEKRTEEADNLVRYVYNQCKDSGAGSAGISAVVDLRAATRHYSANVIRKMVFNRRYFGERRSDGGPGVEEEEHVEALFTVLSLLYAFSLGDYVPSLRFLDLDGHERTMRKAIKVVNKYHEPVIDERIREWRVKGVRKEPEDLLDVLISLKDEGGKPLLNDEEIKAQSADLIYAAVDNPSNAIEWALAEMLSEPDLLRKATAELDLVVGRDRLVQESDVPRLNYLKACAREAFRLHPIAPFNLPHVALSDATVAGHRIPKGSHVVLSRVGLGRNPRVWADPLRFDPERHLREPEAALELAEPDLRFVSFSTGRRGCMGAALGSAMTVMLLARLVQGFEWGLEGCDRVELVEGDRDLFLKEALRARAKLRLPEYLYR